MFDNALIFAKKVVTDHFREGDRAVDATVGNGYDTLFLADIAGPGGKVYGFDIQEQAIVSVRTLLISQGIEDRVELFCAGHETMMDFLAAEQGRVGAVMFNLGFLPGGDKSIITRPENTIAALDAAIRLLRPGGVITIVIYMGHKGGHEEADAVLAWVQSLDKWQYRALRYEVLNQKKTPPWLLAVEKLD